MPRPAPAVVALLLVAVLSAGCLATSDDTEGPKIPSNASDAGNASQAPQDPGGDPTAPDGSSTPEPSPNATPPRRVRYRGCTLLQSVFAVPGPAAPTPDGFTPAAPGYPGLMGAAGTIVVDGHVCDNATLGARTLDDVAELHAYVLVDPPDRYESTDISSYAVEIAGIVATEALHDVYRSWNLTRVELGEIQSTITRARPAAEHARVTARADNVTARLLTATEGAGSDLPDYNARIFSTRDGEVTSVIDIDVASGNQTAGTARLALTHLPGTGDAPTWAALNGVGTGLVGHQSVDRTWTYREPGGFG